MPSPTRTHRSLTDAERACAAAEAVEWVRDTVVRSRGVVRTTSRTR